MAIAAGSRDLLLHYTPLVGSILDGLVVVLLLLLDAAGELCLHR